MKMKIVLFSFLLMTSILFIGCSTKSILHASNGKSYYIDKDSCDRYTLTRDILFCYRENDKSFKQVYHPVTFGYEIDTRKSY